MDEPAGARYLDGDGGLELLAAAVKLAGAELVDATLRSVHVRSGRSRSQVYEAVIRTGEIEQEVLLIAHADRRALPEGALELERDGSRVAVWRFPNDPFLPGLPSAVDPGRIRQLLDDLGAPPGDVTVQTRTYRPSRRAVVEVAIGAGGDAASGADGTKGADGANGADGSGIGRILYFKVLTGHRSSELAAIHRHLADHLPVPRVVGIAADQGIVALEALEGTTLRAALSNGEALPDPVAVVELSRRMAASGLVSKRDPRGFADPTRHVAALIALAHDARHDIERVAAAAAEVTGPLVPVHGDWHGGQLLLQSGEITGVLDLDGAGDGYIAHDAGTMIAHVQVIGDLFPQAAERCERYAAQLFGAYLEVVDAGDLTPAVAAAWLGLAVGPYRAQDPEWQQATRQRIARAVHALKRPVES